MTEEQLEKGKKLSRIIKECQGNLRWLSAGSVYATISIDISVMDKSLRDKLKEIVIEHYDQVLEQFKKL